MAEIKRDKKDKMDKMDKKRNILKLFLIISVLAIVFASCSRAFEPNNYQKKGEKCDCASWK